jgi:hypothetical protein
MAVTAMKMKSSVESLREIVQDLLVPELKAVKAEISSMRNEMTTGLDAVRTEMRLRDEKQTQALQYLDEKQTQAFLRLDEKQTQAFKNLDDKHTAAFKHLDEKMSDSTKQIWDGIQQLSAKMDSSVEFRERLASIEARLPRA